MFNVFMQTNLRDIDAFKYQLYAIINQSFKDWHFYIVVDEVDRKGVETGHKDILDGMDGIKGNNKITIVEIKKGYLSKNWGLGGNHATKYMYEEFKFSRFEWVVNVPDDDVMLRWGLGSIGDAIRQGEGLSMVVGKVVALGRDTKRFRGIIGNSTRRGDVNLNPVAIKISDLRKLDKPYIQEDLYETDHFIIDKMANSYKYAHIDDIVSVMLFERNPNLEV